MGRREATSAFSSPRPASRTPADARTRRVRHGRSVRVYGEYVNGLRADGQEMGPWNNGFLGHGARSLSMIWALPR